MPSHRALACHDILITIFDYFRTPDSAWFDYDPATHNASAWYTRDALARDRQTLARCARVCRAFFYPAVTSLWSSIDELSDLLTVMRDASLPPFLGQPIQAKVDQQRQLEILPKQAMRALCYAQHVRTIRDSCKPTPPSAEEFTFSLWQAGDRTPVLQLNRLRLVLQATDTADLSQILSPSLRCFHVIFRKSSAQLDLPSDREHQRFHESSIRDLSRCIVSKAPHLRYLRITTSGEVMESWFDFVGELRELETFDALEPAYNRSTTHPLLKPLFSLSQLRHLKMRLPSTVTEPVGPNAFPALETLTLDAMFAPMCYVSNFLSAISSSQLRSLVLLNCESTMALVHASCHAIAGIVRSRFSTALRDFHLSLRGVGPVQGQPPPLIKTFEPLLGVHGLTSVRLNISPDAAVVYPSADDLHRMCEAWPKASHVHLSYHASPAPPPLCDLAAVAHQCPDLEELILPCLDASLPTMKDVTTGHGFSALRTLRTFNLFDGGWNSRIPDPPRLAAYLDTLFPEVDWQPPRLASPSWGETVEELVQLRVTRLRNSGLR
ncbi:hypothetical protein C8Q77DRAFT_1065829 [Trametes polyzona]|nr:hypothetical protein C8Q77DRAFT_1065829 [Trametes polyzona]